MIVAWTENYLAACKCCQWFSTNVSISFGIIWIFWIIY